MDYNKKKIERPTMLIKDADRATMQKKAKQLGIKTAKLTRAQKVNPSAPLELICKRIREGKNIGIRLHLKANKSNPELLSTREIAKLNQISSDVLSMAILRNPGTSVFTLAKDIAKRAAARESKKALRERIHLENLDDAIFEQVRKKIPKDVSNDVAIQLALKEQARQEEIQETLTSSDGIYKKRSGRGEQWFCKYKDASGNEREMNLKEIAELEGLKHNSLLSAVTKGAKSKTIHEIVSLMVNRREEIALFDLAESEGLNRRMFIHRYRKHKGALPLSAIWQLTETDQQRLNRSPNRQFETINNMSPSKFAEEHGIYPKTLISRMDAGIPASQAVGRRRSSSYHSYEGIELSLSEIVMISQDVKFKTLESRLARGWDIPKAANLSVSQFYERTAKLSTFWSVGSSQQNPNARLFILDDQPFRAIQLAQISGLSTSTINNRSRNSACPLAITGLNRCEFFKRIADISYARATVLDSCLQSKVNTEKADKVANAKSLHTHAQRLLKQHEEAKLTLAMAGIDPSKITISRRLIKHTSCNICQSEPTTSTHKGKTNVSCSNCGNETGEHKSGLESDLVWLKQNSFGMDSSNIKPPKQISTISLSMVEALISLYYLENNISNAVSAFNKLENKYKTGLDKLNPKLTSKKPEINEQYWKALKVGHFGA
ncbi:hypothetical protein [Vibrio owensii]|uniref:hypothetical protein n=1 Tax=Vibrio owensii TaxID=696485 RepID=UPI0018F13B2C|nr:hypothetical protein [Vibrio owensii]